MAHVRMAAFKVAAPICVAQLYLSNCQIGVEGASAIGKLLATNRTVTTVCWVLFTQCVVSP